MRFRTLLSLAIVVPLFLTGIAVISIMYFNAARRSSEMAEKLLASETARAAQQVRAQSENAVKLAHSLAKISTNGLELADSNRLVTQLLAFLRANPGITWISFSNPAGDFTGAYRDAQGRICTNQSHIESGKTVLTEYVVENDGRRTLLRSDPDSGYDPRTRDFYRQAAAGRDIVWLSPYVFYGQNTPGITCALAVRSPTDELNGVFSVDYDLQTLSTVARQVMPSERSQVMVYTDEEVLVAHSSFQIVAGASAQNGGKLLTIADMHDPVTDAFHKALPPQFPSTASATSAAEPLNRPRFIRFDQSDEPYLACVLPALLESGPIEFVATVAPIHDFAPTAWQFSGGAILIVACALVIAGIFAIALAFGITHPISALVGVSEQIGKGDLNVKIELGPLQEFRRLARAFDVMLVNLRDWVRVRSSIQVAMEIQQNLLPAGPPKVEGFDVAGFSAYCDETGGDYYDYILVESVKPHRLIVALGDVMGHGLPSALLMAGARGILRSSISHHIAPGTLLTHLNSLLYHDTEGERFMTMVLVCVDLETATCIWSSAGHDPPIIYHPATKRFDEPECAEVPLGVMGGIEYGDFTIEPLSSGQVLFVGSDGVWETFNAHGEAFGKDRLKGILAANCARAAEEIKQALMAALESFRGRATAKDDVTFIVIKANLAAT